MSARQGTFVSMEQGRYGPQITVATQKGNWRLDWRGGQLPPIAQGQPVTFEASKNDRGFWQCTGIQPAGQPGLQHASQSVPTMPQRDFQAPIQQPAPQPQQIANPNEASQACAIFVTGIIGRTLQGTGTFPDLKTLRDIVYNAKLAWEIEMEGKAEPQKAGQTQFVPNAAEQPFDGPPPGHPAAGGGPDDPVGF